jgi:hypothetical protein
MDNKKDEEYVCELCSSSVSPCNRLCAKCLEKTSEQGKCCYCGGDCNPCSQSCGFCTRNITGYNLGWNKLSKNLQYLYPAVFTPEK